MKKLLVDGSLAADISLNFQIDTGELVDIRLIFNTRSGFWYADFTYAGVTMYGVKLVPGWPLLAQYHGRLGMPGDFLLLPISVDARDYPMAYEDFGVTWFLYYCNAEEIANWEALRGI